jgi:hypothetical protein
MGMRIPMFSSILHDLNGDGVVSVMDIMRLVRRLG